jgi:hypothetical protein
MAGIARLRRPVIIALSVHFRDQSERLLPAASYFRLGSISVGRSDQLEREPAACPVLVVGRKRERAYAQLRVAVGHCAGLANIQALENSLKRFFAQS